MLYPFKMTSRITCKHFIKLRLTPVLREEDCESENNLLDVLPSLVFSNSTLRIPIRSPNSSLKNLFIFSFVSLKTFFSSADRACF